MGIFEDIAREIEVEGAVGADAKADQESGETLQYLDTARALLVLQFESQQGNPPGEDPPCSSTLCARVQPCFASLPYTDRGMKASSLFGLIHVRVRHDLCLRASRGGTSVLYFRLHRPVGHIRRDMHAP